MGGVINCFYLLSVRSTLLPTHSQHPPFPASASTRRNRLKEARLGFHGVVSSLFTLICFRPVLLPPRTLLDAFSLSLSVSLSIRRECTLLRKLYCIIVQHIAVKQTLHDDTRLVSPIRDGEIFFNVAMKYFSTKKSKSFLRCYRKSFYIVRQCFYNEKRIYLYSFLNQSINK